MTERVNEYDVAETQIEIGGFILHTPNDPKLLPRELPAFLSRREYGHENLRTLKSARLDMVHDTKPDRAILLGAIEFDAPLVLGNHERIQKHLHKQLRDNDERQVSPTGQGIMINDAFMPTAWVRVLPGEIATFRAEIVAPVDRTKSPYYQLCDIELVAQQWVELQDMIAKFQPVSDDEQRNRHIYLDFDRMKRVSEIEFTLMEAMGHYARYGASIPDWGDDINSAELAAQEQYIFDDAARQKIAMKMIRVIKDRSKGTGDMQPLDQGAIMEALTECQRRQGSTVTDYSK